MEIQKQEGTCGVLEQILLSLGFVDTAQRVHIQIPQDESVLLSRGDRACVYAYCLAGKE
jgi:hypothetical protein